MDNISIDVLLIEDNPDEAELTIRELKRNNLANNLFHIKDGEEALELIYGKGRYEGKRVKPVDPKVILLDIQMPKVNGIEVLQQLKSDRSTSEIPIVILTSSKEDPDIKKCYALGANSYIVKPVNFEGFAETIRNLGTYWLLLNQPPLR